MEFALLLCLPYRFLLEIDHILIIGSELNKLSFLQRLH